MPELAPADWRDQAACRANQPAAQRKPLQSVKLGAGMFWKILPPP